MKNNKHILLIITFFLFSCSTINDNSEVSNIIDIAPRIQWNNNGGYCGSSTIQQIALNYGIYISQDACRKVIGDQEILLGINAHKVLDKLSFKYEEWNHISFIPQSKRFLQWIKLNIKNNDPVMIGVYTRNGNNKWYDHIIPITGYVSEKFNNYEDDYLIFNSCWDELIYSYGISELINTRKDSNNANRFSIPKYVNFGIAITGVNDPENLLKPVKIIPTINHEPNITIGEEPSLITAKIKISNLEENKKYIILKYDDYKEIPVNDYLNSSYVEKNIFIAEETNKELDVNFMSNSSTIYRCLEYCDFTI